MLQTITAASPAANSAIRRTIGRTVGPLPDADNSALASRQRPKSRGTPVVCDTGAAAWVVGDRAGGTVEDPEVEDPVLEDAGSEGAVAGRASGGASSRRGASGFSFGTSALRCCDLRRQPRRSRRDRQDRTRVGLGNRVSVSGEPG